MVPGWTAFFINHKHTSRHWHRTRTHFKLQVHYPGVFGRSYTSFRTPFCDTPQRKLNRGKCARSTRNTDHGKQTRETRWNSDQRQRRRQREQVSLVCELYILLLWCARYDVRLSFFFVGRRWVHGSCENHVERTRRKRREWGQLAKRSTAKAQHSAVIAP